MGNHQHRDEHHHHDVDFDEPAMVAHAERVGEVLGDLALAAIAVVADAAERDQLQIRRVLDVGCGPGVGTCQLAQRFAAATVVAADGSATMLDRAAGRARRSGLDDRVETRQVVLPDQLESLGQAELVWASMVLHHLGDEASGLRGLRDRLEPGGLLALVERAGPTRVLPDDVDLGRPGLWERLDTAWAAWFGDMRAGLPDAARSDDYPTMLERAGLEVIADEVLTVDLDPPLDADARRLAHEQLEHLRALTDHADHADLTALDTLLDESASDGILRRPDALLRASRRLYVARRTP